MPPPDVSKVARVFALALKLMAFLDVMMEKAMFSTWLEKDETI